MLLTIFETSQPNLPTCGTTGHISPPAAAAGSPGRTRCGPARSPGGQAGMASASPSASPSPPPARDPAGDPAGLTPGALKSGCRSDPRSECLGLPFQLLIPTKRL